MPSSSATIGPKSVRFVISQDSYTVDDSVYQMDAAPYIENGHSYVPLRYLARALNMGLSWDGTTKTIKLSNGEKTLGLQIGVKQVAVDGESEILNYPPVLKDGHAYLMATLLSTYFNYNLTWDGQNRAVIISQP
jgi:N-acetylmuramoyl-L-alanine amidase